MNQRVALVVQYVYVLVWCCPVSGYPACVSCSVEVSNCCLSFFLKPTFFSFVMKFFFSATNMADVTSYSSVKLNVSKSEVCLT